MNGWKKLFALGALLFVAPSCTTEGFCFANCEHGGQPLTDSGTDNGGQGGLQIINTDGGCEGPNCLLTGDAQAPPLECTPTNGGREVCDGVDNDCDGLIDEPGTPPDGIDFTDVHSCGSCAVNCVDPTNSGSLKNVVTPVCNVGAADGKTAGTCDYTGCAPNTYDVDGDRSNGCEYTCIWNPNGTNTVDLGGAFGCGKDDDCNGKVDDGIDFCKDPQNCGGCGITCTLPNTTSASCVSTATDPTSCDANNTECAVGQCADGFYDADGVASNGCEYPCTPSGPEVCDGKDNDCDGKVDNEDPDLETSADIGDDCAGGDKGICALNRGVTKCIDGLVKCCDVGSNNTAATDTRYPETGLRNDQCLGATDPHVIVPGQLQEVCDDTSGGVDPRFDDDCDGQIDGVTVDTGAVCGNSVGACTLGHTVCVAGKSVCNGSTGPATDPNDVTRRLDPCNGIDDDCDGVIDGTVPASSTPCNSNADCTTAPNFLCAQVSADASDKKCMEKLPCNSNADCTTAPNFLCAQLTNDPNNKGCVAPPGDVIDQASGAAIACNVPPTPPQGATQPCKAGTMACYGGIPQCVDSITRPADADKCGDDTNCNGTLDNQNNLGANDDLRNCGQCGNDCTLLGANGAWQCQAGKCVKTGCMPGFIDCDGNPNDCERACTFQQTDELCDGVDNNCNCQVDEGTITPPPVNQACGVNSAATDPGCSSKVKLACANGGWKCTFTDPAYCASGNCATTPDLCDGKDNNCDGVTDEGFKPPAMLTGFLGQGCFSDDGKPAPGDGPCRTQGQFICRADGSSTMCSATKDLSKKSSEICDGVDNDCNGVVDDPAAVATTDARLGKQCFGDTHGICALPAHAGANACVSGAVLCAGANVLRPGDKLEVCNNQDDDCDGTVDNHLTDTGGSCGSSVGECRAGTEQCVSGALKCNATGPIVETCDGKDNNCNGQIDDSPVDVGTACDVPVAPPAGVPQPCKAGVYACIGSVKVCQGSIKAISAQDACGEDTNCDGKLTNQSGLNNTDVFNCGACGNDCNAKDPNGTWACQAGACVHTGCKTGHIDCDGNPNTCEKACTVTSSTEICNGLDDNCDCQIDNAVPPATPVQVCGVSPSANDVGCTSGVTTACTAGAWKCTFPAGYCSGTSCATTPEKCDGADNNCDGNVDETFKSPILATRFLGQACTTPVSDGPCQGTGSYVCNSAMTGTTCNAVTDTSKKKSETCNGIDDDCNGTTDDAALVSANDNRVGKQCFGGTMGECAAPAHAGSTVCQSGSIVCTGAKLLAPNQLAETCNGDDDDCDGNIDNDPTDVGQSCGSGSGACTPGNVACVSGAPKCQGAVTGTPEKCNGIDDDCNNKIDDSPTDVGGACNVPPAAPAPTAQCPAVAEPCKKGTLTCTGGVAICSGSVTASASVPDKCCEDTNCDGALTNQPDFQTDVANCGSCGNDCNANNAGKHGIWACVAGTCQRSACSPGYIDCDGNANDCERACTPGGVELCNGADDDCNCAVDDNIASVPQPSQVCGVSAAASDANCEAYDSGAGTGIKVACATGAWKCTYPAGYCDKGTPASCSTTPDICDTKDNNCDGNTDQNQKPPVLTTGYLTEPCFSDDGKPFPGDGACQGSGTYVCNGPSATKCNAVKNLAGATAETCNGEDDDCDGLVDETYKSKGTNTSFVAPSVVNIGGGIWMYQYEASRPTATIDAPGTGDGYWCSSGGSCALPAPVPAGATLDKTAACSVSGKIPWFYVTPTEVEQTCSAMGGFICSTANFKTACDTTSAANHCTWAYSDGTATLTACTTAATYATGFFCNLGPYDFNGPNTDGLLPTASDNPPGVGPLHGCYSNIGGSKVFDLTGNLKEITKAGTGSYPLMGGAFSTLADTGATCDFDFDNVSATFQYFDTGFRCCFSSDPTL